MPHLDAWKVRCIFTTADGPHDQTCILAAASEESAVEAGKRYMEKDHRVIEFVSVTPEKVG
jgi:hypothetical protein